MKYFLSVLIITFCLSGYIVYAQETDLSSMQGFSNKIGYVHLGISGYEIFVVPINKDINDKKLVKSVVNKFRLSGDFTEYTDENLQVENKVVEVVPSLKDSTEIGVNGVCYILKKSDKEVQTILFQTLNQRDTTLEKAVVLEYLNNGLSQYILTNTSADSINFVGRTIHLGNACSWRGPNNIFCKGGQVSWSEFTSFEKAQEDINNCIRANMNDQSVVLSEKEIEVLFEGIPTMAYRVVYMPKTIRGSSNPLVVYYLVQNVRGRYVSCILSNYGYNRDDYELTSLLQEFITILKLPDEAYNKFDYPRYETVPLSEVRKYPDMNFFEVRTGATLPLGGLKNYFEVAPSLAVYIGWPLNNSTAIDLGLTMAFPTERKLFTYRDDNREFETKISNFISMELRLRHQKQLVKNIYLTGYGAFGFSTLQTNEKKERKNDEYDTLYAVETFVLTGGLNLRYKRVGCFAEYRYTPYSIAGKVRKSFGHSVFNAGLFVTF